MQIKFSIDLLWNRQVKLTFQTLEFFVSLFLGTVRPRRLKLVTHVDSGQMYRVYRNQDAAAAYSSLYFFIFLSLQFSTLKFFITLFSGTVRPRRLKLGTHVDSGQMYRVYWNQAAAAYYSLYFSFFHFQTLKFFITLFSGTVRPRRLKLGTNVDRGQMYHVYWYQAVAAYLSLYCFIFLSLQFSNIKQFGHFSQELWGLEDWNLVHSWVVGRCIMYTRIRLLLLICPFISFFFLSNFQTLKFFVTLFSWTVIPKRLKLGTHMDSGQMYHVYQNQAAAAYSSLYFLFFLSPIFKH